jgi:CubicO group peptidase (beta-lactamase class C family)
VTQYLGPLDRPGVAAPSEVTLRRTLGHMAGFPVHYQYFYEDGPRRPLPFGETMRCFGPEIQSPGSRYTYSNLGYEVLAQAIARVSGRSYREFLAAEISSPLALTNTTIGESTKDVVGAAERYGTDGRRLPFFVTDFPGGSALYSTAEDLVRFALFHSGAAMPNSRGVLTPASIAEMQEPGPTGEYALGWSVNDIWFGPRRIIWHSGAMPGASATIWMVPAERIAVAVISNQIGAPVNQFAGEILGTLLKVGPQPPAASGAPDKPAAAGVTSPRPAGPDLRGRWRGTLTDCPGSASLLVDVQTGSDIGATFGTRSFASLESSSAVDGRVYGTFRAPTAIGDSTFQLQLVARGDRLEGPVTRRTSLGPRGNDVGTLWASLVRE